MPQFGLNYAKLWDMQGIKKGRTRPLIEFTIHFNWIAKTLNRRAVLHSGNVIHLHSLSKSHKHTLLVQEMQENTT